MRHMFPGQFWPMNSITVCIGSCQTILSILYFIVKVSSRSGKKGEISNFINVNKKGIYQMQLNLINPRVPFILLCDVRIMLKYAFELEAFFHTLYTEERNVG